MYNKDSPLTIQSMFNSIANRYDFTNAVLSFSFHKFWNRALVRSIFQELPLSHILLDLCSGTGDIAFEYLRKSSNPCQVYLIDFSSEMLEHAKRKANQLGFNSLHQLSYIEADVQSLPFPDQFADCLTMAYGIRNVQDPNCCIKEAFRVLKSGGCFGILELTRPRYRLLHLAHQIYLYTFMPFLGKCLTDNKQAYQYLCRSIQTFIAPEELQRLLVVNGFVSTKCYPLTGGIATLIIGYKK